MGRLAGEGYALEQELPAPRRDHPRDDAHEPRLSRSVWAHDRHRLSGLDAKAHVPERGEGAVPRGDTSELEHRSPSPAPASAHHELLAEVRLDHPGVLGNLGGTPF